MQSRPRRPYPLSKSSLLAAINDKNNAVISINAIGIIQMANKAAQKLLGVCAGSALVVPAGTARCLIVPPPRGSRPQSRQAIPSPLTNNPHTPRVGYRKGELESKNVSILMPPPYNGRHNRYLMAYANTGATGRGQKQSGVFIDGAHVDPMGCARASPIRPRF